MIIFGASPLHGKNIEIRTLAVGTMAGSPTPTYVQTQGGYERLTFSTRQTGSQISVPAVERLPLFAKNTESEAADAYQVVEELDLPKDANSVLLLALFSKDGATYRAIDDQFSAASDDQWLMINTTSRAVKLQLGSDRETLAIEAEGAEICKIKAPEGGSVSAVGTAEWDGEEKKFYSTYWPVRKGERAIVVFFEHRGRIRVLKLSDAL